MKKICAVIGSLLLAGSMLFAASNKNAGSLVVYGSCEEEYVFKKSRKVMDVCFLNNLLK